MSKEKTRQKLHSEKNRKLFLFGLKKNLTTGMLILFYFILLLSLTLIFLLIPIIFIYTILKFYLSQYQRKNLIKKKLLDIIKNYFKKFGNVIETRIYFEEIRNNNYKGYGFILFETEKGLLRSLEEGNTHTIEGVTFDCKQSLLKNELEKMTRKMKEQDEENEKRDAGYQIKRGKSEYSENKEEEYVPKEGKFRKEAKKGFGGSSIPVLEKRKEEDSDVRREEEDDSEEEDEEDSEEKEEEEDGYSEIEDKDISKEADEDVERKIFYEQQKEKNPHPHPSIHPRFNPKAGDFYPREFPQPPKTVPEPIHKGRKPYDYGHPPYQETPPPVKDYNYPPYHPNHPRTPYPDYNYPSQPPYPPHSQRYPGPQSYQPPPPSHSYYPQNQPHMDQNSYYSGQSSKDYYYQQNTSSSSNSDKNQNINFQKHQQGYNYPPNDYWNYNYPPPRQYPPQYPNNHVNYPQSSEHHHERNLHNTRNLGNNNGNYINNNYPPNSTQNPNINRNYMQQAPLQGFQPHRKMVQKTASEYKGDPNVKDFAKGAKSELPIYRGNNDRESRKLIKKNLENNIAKEDLSTYARDTEEIFNRGEANNTMQIFDLEDPDGLNKIFKETEKKSLKPSVSNNDMSVKHKTEGFSLEKMDRESMEFDKFEGNLKLENPLKSRKTEVIQLRSKDNAFEEVIKEKPDLEEEEEEEGRRKKDVHFSDDEDYDERRREVTCLDFGL